MQLISTLTTLLLLLTSNAIASPTPIIPRSCTIIYPTLQVPVDSSTPNKVYGSGSAMTLWKTSDSNRNILLSFTPPIGANNCQVKFHTVANPPVAISGPVPISAYVLSNSFGGSTSWNTKPGRAFLYGGSTITVSSTAPTDQTVISQGCAASMNYEIEVPRVASLTFTSDANNGWYMTYGC